MAPIMEFSGDVTSMNPFGPCTYRIFLNTYAIMLFPSVAIIEQHMITYGLWWSYCVSCHTGSRGKLASEGNIWDPKLAGDLIFHGSEVHDIWRMKG
jgi:hypothetical protein